MTGAAGPDTPFPLEDRAAFEHPLTLDAAGQAWLAATLAAPGTSWARGEAAVVLLDVDGVFAQEIILAGGEEPVEDLRLLGRLRPGPHRVRLRLHRGLSAPAARAVVVHTVRTGAVPDTDPAAPVWRHAPVLHYRALHSPLDSLTTDTPVVLFHRPVAGADGRGIEYHVVFSHEDEGTDLTGLLARWGHTTDIEWVYRIVQDGAGRTVREEFQGPEHRATPFRGGRALGGHPVLQVATLNGMVTDRVRCPFRAALAPALAQPPDEPREGVQHRYPWVYRASALEVVRQVPLAHEPSPEPAAPVDPRRYLFLHWKRVSGPPVALEAAACVRGEWRSSGWGRPEMAFSGPDAESTAVRCGPGTAEADITGIAVRSVEPPEETVELRLVRAFLLDGDYRPRPPLAAGARCRLTPAQPRAVAWERR